MPWALRGLRDGVVTTRYPDRPDLYADTWRGAVTVLPGATRAETGELAALCPTGAIDVTNDRVSLDRGACILCGACVRERPDAFAWRPGSEIAALDRSPLVVPQLPETDQAIEEVRTRLAGRVRALRRSVHIRHVDAGSDGSEEWEIQALLGPVYDVHRLGIFFTATPRHADILLVTGAGAHGMAQPLRRTLDGMPRPTVVIAAGTDAISGGLVSPSYATGGGIGDLAPVDVWVPGSPPSPFSLLHAVLLALGRIPHRRIPQPDGQGGDA